MTWLLDIWTFLLVVNVMFKALQLSFDEYPRRVRPVTRGWDVFSLLCMVAWLIWLAWARRGG